MMKKQSDRPLFGFDHFEFHSSFVISMIILPEVRLLQKARASGACSYAAGSENGVGHPMNDLFVGRADGREDAPKVRPRRFGFPGHKIIGT